MICTLTTPTATMILDLMSPTIWTLITSAELMLSCGDGVDLCCVYRCCCWGGNGVNVWCCVVLCCVELMYFMNSDGAVVMVVLNSCMC
jgi:hypothetical protein